jgi:hypothetical protein
MSRPQNLLSSDAPDQISSGDARATPEGSKPGVSKDAGSNYGPGAPRSAGKFTVWLQRSELFLRVVVRIYVGVLVLLLPWSHLWDDNRLLNFYPWLMELSSNGAVRGIVSGLGLLNVWIAISDAIHYRES